MRLTLLHFLWLGLVFAPLLPETRRWKPSTMIHRGRKHLVGSPYVLPNNATEHQRLDAQHQLMRLVLGAPSLGALESPRAILDVGCGTGRWCREMAARFPDAAIVGLDYSLRPAQEAGARLKAAERARMVQWVEADALAPLPLISNSFDFVHLRFAATWIPFGRWPEVLAELLRVTKPGGVVELVEGGMPESQDQAYNALGKTFGALLRQRGMSERLPEALPRLLEMAGAIDIECRTFQTGETPEQQQLLFETTRQGFAALVPLLAKHLSPADLAAYRANLETITKTTPHVTRRDVVVWGKKPL